MTARSCLGALLLVSLLYVTISAARDAADRAGTHPQPIGRTGERIIY